MRQKAIWWGSQYFLRDLKRNIYFGRWITWHIFLECLLALWKSMFLYVWTWTSLQPDVSIVCLRIRASLTSVILQYSIVDKAVSCTCFIFALSCLFILDSALAGCHSGVPPSEWGQVSLFQVLGALDRALENAKLLFICSAILTWRISHHRKRSK